MTEPQAQASWMLLPRFSKHDSGSETTQVNSESLQSFDLGFDPKKARTAR